MSRDSTRLSNGWLGKSSTCLDVSSCVWHKEGVVHDVGGVGHLVT